MPSFSSKNALPYALDSGPSTRSLLRTTERSKAPDASYQRPEPLILGVCPEVPCPILDRRRWFSALGPGADPAGALVAARSSHLGVLLPRLGEVVVGQVHRENVAALAIQQLGEAIGDP